MSAMARTTTSRPDLLGGIIERLNGTVAQVSQLRQSLGNLEMELMEIRRQCEDELHACAAAAFTANPHDGNEKNAITQNSPSSGRRPSSVRLQNPERDQVPILADRERKGKQREREDKPQELFMSKQKLIPTVRKSAMKTKANYSPSLSPSPGVSPCSHIPGGSGSPAARVVKTGNSLKVSRPRFRTMPAQSQMQGVATPGPLRNHAKKPGGSGSPAAHVMKSLKVSHSRLRTTPAQPPMPDVSASGPLRKNAKRAPMPSQITPRPPPRPPTQPYLFPKEIDLSSYPPELKHEGDDWFVLFNPSPKVERVLDVNLVHMLIADSEVYCAKFSRDGKQLAVGCCGMAQIYDVKTGAKTFILDHENDEDVWTVSFSPDGEYLATGGDDQQIRIWDIANEQIHDFLKGHPGSIWSLDFLPNGQFIVSGSRDGTVRIWDVHNKTFKVLTINGHHLSPDHYVWSVAISPDGRYVAVGSEDTVVTIWEITTGVLVQTLRGHMDGVSSVAFMADGKGLISGSLDATLKYWDVSGLGIGSDANTALTSTSSASPLPCLMNLIGHNHSVCSTAVSHDGAWVVSGSEDGYVVLWDTRTGVLQCLISGHMHYIEAVDLSPMGNLLAMTDGYHQVHIWSYGPFR